MIDARTKTRAPARGLVILVVLVVVTLSALIASSVLLMGESASEEATHDRRGAQSRLAAWSGVQAVMSRLSSQRDDLLDGGAPVLPESWTFPVAGGGPAPAFRVVGVGGRMTATSENARLDVNLASAEMLESLPMIDVALARAIVGARPFSSMAELAGVAGVTPALLYGEVGDDLVESDAPASLFEVLTVFSFDPNIQRGEGENGEAHRGERRINLGLGWSEELERGVTDRWNESAAAVLKNLFEQGESLERTSDVVGLYRRFGAAPADWVEGLDALTTVDSEHVRGLVDLNRAPPAVLAAIPGIDESAAGEIGDARERLGLDQRTSIVWPVIEGILSEDEFQQASDWLTTRSMQWRVRIEGGTQTGSGLARDASEAALRDRVVYECVIDVSSRRPRVAYLRDVTGLELALAMGRTIEPELELDTEIEREASAVDEPGAMDDAPADLARNLRREAPAPDEDEAGESEASEPAAPAGRIGRWSVGQVQREDGP